ncbi:hypothetical protein CBOM_07303 [Ceraceosorus bombacis]|uniref:Uncharacterized protein n=1 Tax=Ceraceosorus bombacis TaxID=401625 RepID=A0A0P1B7R9_9BASI|nr:hypothetical protein CBOM_07303 [Ceraceosorus bombacis]
MILVLSGNCKLSNETIARLEVATQANKGLIQLKMDLIVHKSTAVLAQHKADQEHLQKEVQIKCQELEKKVEVLALEIKRLKLASKFQWSKYFIF